MTARQAGRVEDDATLRDAVLLTRPSDDLRPRGQYDARVAPIGGAACGALGRGARNRKPRTERPWSPDARRRTDLPSSARRRGNSKLPHRVNLIMLRPLVTSAIIEKEIKVATRGALNLVAQLNLRELTARRRFQAWGRAASGNEGAKRASRLLAKRSSGPTCQT